MADQADETLTSTFDAFGDARGEEIDEAWAFAVSWKLMMNGIQVEQVREALEEALALVRETQESPEHLFGEPTEHATELYRRWKSEGRLPPTSIGVPNARTVAGSSLRTAGWIGLLVFALTLFRGEEVPLGFLALPLGLGFAAHGGLALWEWVSRRWATPLAVGSMVVATLVASLLMAGVLMSTEASLGGAMPWLLLAEAAVVGLVGRGITIYLTAKAVAELRDDPGDEQWVARFSGILRGPGWTADARVREIVAEARSHAAESGRSLSEEFGAPEHYAAQFGANRARQSRLKVAFLALLGLVSLLGLVDGWSWTSAGMSGLLAWMAWSASRELRDPKDQSGR